VLVFFLLRQHGGLLLRLEALEDRLAGAGLEGLTEAAGPDGVPPGTRLETFRLPDVRGGTRTLDDYRGTRVLLVHWSPSCGFCDAIAPDLAAAAPELRKRNTELVLVSSGDAKATAELVREYGFDCPVLLEDGADPVDGFAGVGTPAAYLLDEEGRVEHGLALGADKVPEVLREALGARRRLSSERPLSDSRLERDGLKAGTPAPPFTLPGLDGGTVSLSDYRGQRVVLVFSDPTCGPCQELAPALVRLHDDTSRAGVAIVMVSRGTPDENRKKCAEHGIDFPVALQRGWRLSKEYGIFATPVAFLIDDQGVIARDVAKGSSEILALAESAVREKGGATERSPVAAV
jgi:peroxiredoxin